MSDFKRITEELLKFRDDRNWKQFHNSKDLATAISIEAGELNELFLWKTIKEIEAVDKEKIADELADIFAFSLLLANNYKFDIEEIVLNKIKKNDKKYPVEKAKNSAKKYNEL